MEYYRTSLAILLLTCVILLHCSSSTEPVDKEPTRLPSQLTANELQLVASTDKFGFELFRQVNAATPTDENIFISPLSAAYALAMAYNGAAKETRTGIATTLAFGDLTQQQVNESFAGLTFVLTGVDPSVTINIANAIWNSPSYSLVPEFVTNCQNYFDATVSPLDFTEPSAADTINNWAAKNTNDRIKKVVDPPLDPSIVCMLANAVYFKAGWTFPFDTSDTRTDSFYTGGGDVVSADYMFLDADDFISQDYEFDPDFTVLVKRNEFMAFSMPYGDRWFRMTIFLPAPSISVDSFIAGFTAEKWGIWRDEFNAGRFKANFPKFKFSYDTGLDQMLKAMGMEKAFQPGTADFSNMIQGGGIWIDTVIHSTFVQVDEKGTEAAAVTIIVMPTSLPPYINCNRPFAFMIWEKESGAVLFMGKVAQPVWEDE